jgi:hypothetical protein
MGRCYRLIGTLHSKRRLMLFVALAISSASLALAQASQDTWTGQAQCQLTVQSPTYVYQEVQTWAITGPPDSNLNTVYPATWSVTGQGGRQDSSGAQIVRAQWQTAVPPMNAPLRIFVNSGNQLIIKSYHAQLRMDGAAIGSRQVMAAGVAQNPTSVSFAEFEWQFPRVEVEATRTDVAGTSSSPVNSGVGPLQPPGTSATATCQWHFSKGEHSRTVLDRTPVPGASPQILQAANGGVNSSPSATQSISAPVPTQVARNPLVPTSNPEGSSNSSASVDANARPAVYAAPSGVGASSTAASASQVGLQAPTQIAKSIGPTDQSANAPITGGTSTPTGSGAQSSLPNTHAPISATAIASNVSLPAPSAFTAQSIGDGSVRLHWQAVSGASQYRVDGSGIAAAGLYVAANSTATTIVPIAPGGTPATPSLGTRIQNVPPGPGTWHIAAVDAHKLYDPKLTSTAATIVRYVPAHAGQWLTKNNGAGNFSKTFSHYLSLCPQCLPGVSFSDILHALGVTDDQLADGNNDACTCLGEGGPCTWTDLHAARYENVTEFGTSRITRCWDALPGPRTVCYSKSGDHGVTMIVKDSDHTWFLTFAWRDNTPTQYTQFPNPAKEVVNWFFNGVPIQSNYILTTEVTLDSEGPKSPPHACLSCHGGTFDGVRVSGATLLPLDTGLLRIDDRSNGMAANFLGVNQAVMNHGPSPAVKRYITGLYGGFDFPSGWGDLDYVPQGWKQQSDFYKAAVKPYCMMCHLATPSNLDFSTYGNFAQNKDLIKAEVCSGHTMPHAEYPFKQFWTKDTGNIFLPGYLVAALGITSCQ